MTEPPAPRGLSDLSAREARPIFERVVRERPMRLAAFVDEVRRRGGPADRLDRSLDSLEAIWSWFLEQPAPAEPVDDEAMRAARPPWWYDFHPAWGGALGPDLAWLATGLGDYFFECLGERVPAAGWRMSTRSAHRRHPVLAIPDRGEVPYTAPLGLAVRAVQGSRHTDLGPRALRRLAEVWIGLDEAHEALLASLARPLPPYVVERIAGSPFTHRLSFADAVAHRRPGRFRRILERLAAEPSIEKVVHEDREVVLVRAAGRSVAEIEAVLASAWDGRSHEAERADVP